MLLFARRFSAIQEQELGPEQTDSVSSHLHRFLRLGRASNVGGDFNPRSISGHRLLVRCLLAFDAKSLPLTSNSTYLLKPLIGRRRFEQAVIAVQHKFLMFWQRQRSNR